ncbi:MAG TPA: hypothetical protein VHL80_20795 [Polyangia bacterium]|nr:hypothetical protein [Polyangia bacterium]
MGRTGLVAAFLAGAAALACAREGLLEPATSGASGRGGAAGAGAVPDPPAPLAPAPVAGDWLMYGFEDPVAVHLEVGSDGRSYDVTGTGCAGGWKSLFDPSNDARRDCGEVHGHGAGLALDFSFHFEGWKTIYTMHVQASRDGGRMAGTLDSEGPDGTYAGDELYGWLRLEDVGIRSSADEWTPPRADLGPLPDDSWRGPAGFAFALQGEAPLGPWVPGQRYLLRASSVGVDSLTLDLGAFWNPDFHWDEATRTLTAGPVPETVPGRPVRLELHVEADSKTVRDVVATTADGTTATLLRASPDP